MIPKSEWKWFGSPGHFICSRWCRFHLCTQVGKYLISTVGELVHPRHSSGSEMAEAEWLKDNWPGEDIGFNRKYETMVFKAGEPCNAKDCDCGQPSIEPTELTCRGYNDRKSAAQGHLDLCEEWSRKGD